MDDLRTIAMQSDAGQLPVQTMNVIRDASDGTDPEQRKFLAHLSHELNTPMNAIIGFTEILKESIADPVLRHYLDVIRTSGDKLLAVVNNGRHPTAARPIDASMIESSARPIDCAAVTQIVNAAQLEWNAVVANGRLAELKNVIFVVDDCEDNLSRVLQLFEHESVSVFPFISGNAVLEAVRVATPDLILLDVVMPMMDGFEVCRRIKAQAATADVPIIFLTGKADADAIVTGFEAGGVDYIAKPFGKDELLSRVRTHLKLHQMERSLKQALIEKEELLNETLKGSVKVLIDILAMTNTDAFAQTLRVRNVAKKMAARLGLENIWEIEIGILLSHLGCAVISSDIVMKKHSGHRLTTQENAVYCSHPKAAARFIANIPRLEQVAVSIQNQYADYNPKGEPDILRDFIRIVFDYDHLIQTGCTQQQALEEMNSKIERYNPRVLGALEAEVRRLMEGYVVRTVPFEELRPGMVLADDIRNASNIILVRRSSELSEVLLERLQNLRYCGRTSEPVKILEQIA